MFDRVRKPRWYTPRPDDADLPGDIEGLGIGDGKVWMGSNGVNIIARDLRDGRWSRHDVKARPFPGIHATVLHADDHYVVALTGGPSGGWRERLPDVRRQEQLGPAVEVYSVKRGAWLRITGVARENVLEFGWTDYIAVSMPCDTRRFARVAIVPLESCMMPQYAKSARGESGYELGRTFNEPGSPFRFILRTKELDAAFKSMP